jgi:hypothetical protein
MKKTIPKNKRRPFPYFDFLIPVLIKKDKSFWISKYFMFTNSSLYFFNDEDQHDVNKLFGFSFGWHHKDSVRFGWRPSEEPFKMEIVGYEYINGLRVPTIPICDVHIGVWYRYELKYNGNLNQIEYYVSDGEKQFGMVHPITLKKKLNLGYRLYLYFGGNKKAPHDIIIYQK